MRFNFLIGSVMRASEGWVDFVREGECLVKGE